MNCITLTEPFASLISVGAKKIETRGWPAPDGAVGRPLAIHAATGMTGADLDWLEGCPEARDALWPWLDGEWERPKVTDAFPETRGRVLATATLAGCFRVDRSTPGPHLAAGGVGRMVDPGEVRFGNYRVGRWAWVLEDVRPLPKPVPARGALGIWLLDGDLLAQLREGEGA